MSSISSNFDKTYYFRKLPMLYWFLTFLAQYYLVICSIFTCSPVLFHYKCCDVFVFFSLLLISLTRAILYLCFQRKALFGFIDYTQIISFLFLVISTFKKNYFSALAFFGLAQLDFSNLCSWNLISDFFILFQWKHFKM